ncbi:glycoside hydrolase family 2 protein [Abyssalbus ytuae]|uniref:DUF4982 domain-containing protein n=1 Tax=Abyssalbus ytuae TaxID=2926907 RepID=A0A9E7D2X4_9FLAO|nr:glycoside hydrolase family 2 TIM barrel-domain containing protein [Abyssalbus ytuae]UOB18638.1 DUF4982 domain-containing protein [Abyssalbus ytuae]
MNLIYRLYLLFSVFIFLSSCSPKADNNLVERAKVNFGSDWLFQKGDTVNSGWQAVTLPHTSNIEPLVVNNQWQGVSWYKKTFTANNEKKNLKHFLYFEGIMQEAQVWCNGEKVTIHKGGYLPFTADITNFISPDNHDNEILIKVVNTDNSKIPPGKELKVLDFNLYGGIYRNAYLITTGQVYITDAVHANKKNGGGVLVHFNEVSDSSATGIVKIHVQNDSEQKKNIKPLVEFVADTIIKGEFSSKEIAVNAGSSISFEIPVTINSPDLWSPETPNLYDLNVSILNEENETLDNKSFKTGIRSMAITEDGFYLNGKQRFINGTNRHQEYPYVGYALSDKAQYRDAYKIKQAGFDFVRLSHYPHAEAFMDACDELGLMVMNCIPGWQYYEEGEFVENSLQNIKDMARRDRNHPSVIFWENSLNESEMTEEYMVKANKVLKEELPYDNIYSAGWIDHPSYDIFIPARQHNKAPDYWNDYDKGARKILIAEYGDWEYYAHNAGFNQKEFKDLKEDERTSRQLRGFGEKRLLQQALNFQEAFNSNIKGKNTIGHANWLMFDYNRGYANDIESSGISDIFRIPKFSYYFYKSQKPPYQDNFTGPMVYIANYWQKDSSGKVVVYSNTDTVELYLNDNIVERKKAGRDRFSDSLKFPPFTFNLPEYKKGSLRAVAYIDNKKVAEHLVTTPGQSARIALSYDESGKPLKKSENDVVFLYAKVTDEYGNIVHSADNEIKFEVIGENAQIIGENPVKAEAGIATVLLKTNSTDKSLSVKATSPDLEEISLELY